MRAFTLLDVVLSMMLLAVGVGGLLVAFRDSVSGSLAADETFIATNIAQEYMEKIIGQRDCNLVGCGYAGTLTSINAGGYNANAVAGYPKFKVTTTVVEVNPDNDNTTDDFLDTSVGSGYARVKVQVFWNNNLKSIQIATLITNY